MKPNEKQLKNRSEKTGAIFKLLFFVYFAVFVAACSSTVVPKPVYSEGPSYSGKERNSGIVEFVEGGAIFDNNSRERYRALVQLYGSYFAPPLTLDRDLVYISEDRWFIDNELLSKALQMNLWRKAGKEPATK